MEKTMVIDDNIIYLSRVGRLRIAKCIKPSRRKHSNNNKDIYNFNYADGFLF